MTRLESMIMILELRRSLKSRAFHNGGYAIRFQEEIPIQEYRQWSENLHAVWEHHRKEGHPVHRPVDCQILPSNVLLTDDFKVVYNPL